MRAVNLIPAEQRSGASVGAGRSEGAAYAVLVLLAGIALLAFLYGRADKQISSRRAQVATVTAQAQHAQAQAGRLAPYTSFVALREQRVKAVADLVDSRFDWAHAFHEFGRVLPTSVSVATLTGTIGAASGSSAAAAAPAPSASTSAPAGSASTSAPAASAPAGGAGSAAAAAQTVTSSTPPGSVPTFTLTGCAKSQPAVALMLTRLRLIDGVANVTLQTSAKSGSSGATASGTGGCQARQPAYTATVSFDPLPTPAATQSATAVSATKSTGGAR
ncbi:MAG TPA: hypothetical protein VGN08_08840 [Solirubrobacteraceae bacterium]|jgi:hypothetical protein